MRYLLPNYEAPGNSMPVIWKDDNDDNEWVVEYGYLSYDTFTKECHPGAAFQTLSGLKAAILFARNSITSLELMKEQFGVEIECPKTVWLLQPDDAIYVDITDDADAMHALFRYDE